MSDIAYRFLASGHEDVEKAFTTIEKSAVRHKRVVEESMRTQRQAATARRGVQSPEDRKYKEVERSAAKYEKEAQREVKVAERAAISKVRAQERAQRYVAKIRDKHFLDEQKSEEKRIALASKTVNKRQQLVEAAAKRERAAKDRADRENAQKRAQSIGVLKDLAGGAFLATVASGGALIGGAARESMQLQETAARIAIQGRGHGEEFRDAGALRRSFEQTAINAPGQTAAGVADAVQRFVSLTGNLDKALEAKGSFAMIASASGANIGDIAEAAASLFQQFDVKSVDDMTEALAALNMQGKNGAFEIKDAAAQFQRLAAAGAAFGIPKGVAGVKVLGGLTQIARSGTGSAEQASTAVEAMLNAFKAKQTDLRAAGVQVFDKSGKARDVRDLLTETISKVGGHDAGRKQAGLLKIFEREGVRAISPLLNKYNEAYQGAKGTEYERTAAAVAKLREEFSKAIDVTDARGEAEEDAAMAQQQASARVSTAWESIKAKTADALLPALANLAEKIADKDGMLDPFIEAVGLAAEGLNALADLLGFKHKKTNAELEKDAQRELGKYKRANNITDQTSGPASPEQMALEDRVRAAHETVFGGGKKFTGSADFALQYLNAADQFSATSSRSAYDLAQQIQGGTAGSLSNDFVQRHAFGETEQQQELRHQYEQQTAGTRAESEFNTRAAQDAADEFASTVKAVTARIAAAGGPQGSVVTGQ